MSFLPRLSIVAAVAGFAALGHAATVIPVTGIFGHNEKDNYTGNIGDVINGSGMNGNPNTGDPGWPTGAGDPSTWTATDNSYQSEWQSGDLLDAGENPTNGKIGWAILDLGASTINLGDLYVWHIRENSGRVATSYNVYLAETPTTAPTHGPTGGTSIDYDFAGGGWTLAGSGTGTYRGTETIDLGQATARYIGLEILTNGGDGTRVGFAEVGVTQVPEPSVLALFGLVCLPLLRRRR